MTAFHFRSLLLAAIVISNCITWTASRHHYAHNVHQHRTRHRRQGAGLYLPASYVIPGGEGSGPWGEWGEVSPCSRTCGGGVASQKRICLQPGPEGSQCTGGDTKYFSCQTQDCPDGSGDFRAEQCAEFNDKAFRGFTYNWVPYTKAPNPCELNCMPHGERFYFRHKQKVIDGTRCDDESFDVCVDGRCQPVGCDMMLNSTAREDKCRECRGNGANCHTTDGIFDSQDLTKGYNDILLIPAGSTTILIEEIEPSNNYLALRAKNGTYYLNGHYHIDFPRTIMIAGALWTYERSQQGFAAPDRLRCLGPTNEPLYLSLLLQDENVGIRYEYSVPNNSAPPTDKRYNWVHEEFTPCSATCGGGFQTRNVTCRSREQLDLVKDNLCDEGLKPPTNQSCSPDPCPPQWAEGPWGECSQRCGEGGVKSREVTCQKIIANGETSIVPDKECFDLLGPKPEVFQKCNEDAPCPTWFVGHWKPCDKLCDEGKQTRSVICYQKIDGRITVLDDSNCTETKPEVDQPCLLQPCDGVDWVASDWSGCDTCTSKFKTRTVVCSTKHRQVLNESFCAYHTRPSDREECNIEELPPCEVQWYATQWSKCSASCGEGVKTRKVFCGSYNINKEGEGFVNVVKDVECAKLPKYNDTKPCTVPQSECPSQWFAGPWSACTEKCGGGEQTRKVMCFRGDKEAGDCDGTTVLDPTQLCNEGPCDPDHLLPVTRTSTVVMDEEDDCEEDYPEAGLDVDLLGSTPDIALSDSPGYAEHESTLEYGSGFGSSLSTDDLTTLEGSGFSSLSTMDTTDSDYTTDDETGSGETTLTNEPKSKETDTTRTTLSLPNSGSTESIVDGSTPTSITEGTDETSSSGSTDSSESVGTGETDNTSSSDTSDTGSTSSTDVTESTVENTGSTDSSESTIVKETGSTSESVSPSSEETSSSDTGSTESSLSTDDKGTGSTDVSDTDKTDSTVSGDTESTESTVTDETSSTESTVAGETSPTESTVTGESSPSESTITGETSPSESTVTEETSSTESTITEETSSTESTITEETSSTESTITEETSSTESTVTEETSSTESTITEETSSTESTVTEETSSTESTVTEETSSTESTITEETSSTESTVTEETSSTESTITEETSSSESTINAETSSSTSETSSETSSTDSKVTKSTETTTSTPSWSTESSEESETDLSTDSSETTNPSTDTTVETESTVETSTSSGVDSTSSSESAESSTSTGSTESTISSEATSSSESSSSSSESSTVSESSSSSPESTTASESSSSSPESTTASESSSSSSESSAATESSSSGSESTGAETSTSAGSESTTESLESSSLSSISTGAETSTSSESESTTETTDTSSSISSESTTGVSESSKEESTSVSGEITTGSDETTRTTLEFTDSEASTISSFSTTEGSTIESSTGATESTVKDFSTTEWSTSASLPWASTTKGKVCKPRKPKCSKTAYGCCPDKKTTATGPFDEGCPKPQTCEESTYGCCPDGLSPAGGEDNEGCPVEPCADTLFGCCLSDNKTAAQGNDQDGCPPPCVSSQYGCCADNETEAMGPHKEGCLEYETTSTEAATETTTETTESSSTSEGDTSEGTTSTASEETTDVVSSTTFDPCSGFEFGCCSDNETEAAGPNGEGCSCNATEFGCCPDGVSPALGPENEGCEGDCHSSPHGCCQDGKTPAHGPEFEGCCLLSAFGCCPDNRKPAEGPHLEGCGCQYALHGCCPDNITIAQGPDNQGCGCQYTQFGCCPDRHTAASGPDNEGCACNTFQFGCCADGVTNAQGPDQQGCHCRDSKFGCCGDGETAAAGPDAAGCDCSSSQHGCCPDGRTEAAGPKFLGCTDAPENKQAACSLSTDPGTCHNFTAMWYYDIAYGGCSRFWYGGCEGNGNRFATKEECEDICVQPAPKDACKLPSVKGACDADYQHWYYNSTREQCIPFRYGGCLGNANNFETRELCQKQCEPSSVAGQCELPIDQGSCAGNFSRWGFNSEAHRCEQFIWGGCEGNSNRFSSEAACQMRCTGTQPPQCTQPHEAGNCTGKEALWSFSQSENRCLPFYYSGCGGNDNRFRSRESCEQTCPSAYVPDKCTLPAETGQCSNYREKWFYDTTFKRCRLFYYGGCGGNENNFATEAECESSCSETRTTTTTTTTTTSTAATPTTTRHTEPEPQPQPQPEPGPSVPERSEFCFNAIDAGPCTNTETRYAYDSSLGRCVTFQYGGCGGNQNNFPDEAYCTYYCQPIQDVCQLPMLQGPCEESLMRWFYDPTSDSCSQFTYGGCGGNDNRFETIEACENRCRAGPAPVEPTTPTTTVIVDEPSECKVSESLEDCRSGGVVWYFDSRRHECVSHSNQESGAVCRHTGTFLSQEACERSCGAFRGVDVCKQRRDPGPCQEYAPKYYFDQSTGQCHEFVYGGCLGGANRFSTIEECTQVCQAAIADPCTLPPEQGNCYEYIQQWYYDSSRDECNQFVYTGCSGNGNRFESQRDCEARCRRPSPVTTPGTPAQQSSESECRTPSSLAPCGNNVTVFYYDSERRQCLASGIGGCGHPNSYSTEEECERRCGAFRGLDVCGARLDPGPCRASFPKIYWDAASGTCQEFTYGGCDGGPNRFSSVEECMGVCGDTGPDPNLVLPQDCTPYQQECEALVCPYGTDRFAQDGCTRCQCKEDPCIRARCPVNQQCVAVAIRDSATQEAVYTARCVAETNEVYDCDEYVANCSRLRCEFGVQRTRAPDGCERCACVQVEIDCAPLADECNQLRCNYGVERAVGTDGCERCKCKNNPCESKSACGEGERCVVQPYRNGVEIEPKFIAECRPIVKAGACPLDTTTTNEVSCRHECGDDADCRGVGKCCRRGCSDLCLVPVEQTSPNPLLTTTIAPDVPAAPQALPQPEPEVSASEGGAATLRCLFHGNPPPKITWRFGELTIDGNDGRYRLMSDGALQIVSLYRNDTGVYICVADNGLGVATQEIHLVVNDPVTMPVGIAGDENAVVTGELGRPLQVRCLAYGYPPPSVFWYRGYEGAMVPYNDAVYEARGNVLLIRSLAIETLGQYTCQAYNGEGKAASWVVYVRAYMPEGFFLEHEFLVPRGTVAPRPRPQPPTTAETTTTTTTTTTEAPRPLFTVPVSTHITSPYATLNIGGELHLTCEVDGFPEPEVHWTRNGGLIQADGDRITITGSTIVSRLTVARVTVADSGLYACHASNPYSAQTDSTQINVQQLVVPAKCTDNPFFANCDLIVRSKFCRHKYYSKFCCKSCVEAGQLDPQEAELQADQPLKKK